MPEFVAKGNELQLRRPAKAEEEAREARRVDQARFLIQAIEIASLLLPLQNLTPKCSMERPDRITLASG